MQASTGMNWIYIGKVFLLHVFVLACYVTFTGYWFVVNNSPNPIGLGLQQLVCMIFHFLLTIVITSIGGSASGGKLTIRKALIHTTILIVIVASYISLSPFIDEWLWSLR
jgi:hypothetical protein